MIDVVQVVAAQAVGRGLWHGMEILYNPITVKLRFLRGVWMVDKHVHKVGEEVTREVTKKLRGMVGW